MIIVPPIDVLEEKWNMKILLALRIGGRHFNELVKALNPISATILSEKLKELEKVGYVRRKVNTTRMPAMVYYSLTEYGRSIAAKVNELTT